MMHTDLQELYSSGGGGGDDVDDFGGLNPQPLLTGQSASDQWAAPPKPIPVSSYPADLEGGGGYGDEGVRSPVSGRGGICSCFSVDFYRPYFDVNTEDVKFRLVESVKMWWGTPFLEVIADRPEFYGPFWNAMTLLLAVAVTDNFSSWTKAAYAGQDWSYDLHALVTCAGIVYGFAAIIPLLLWVALNQIGVAFTLPQLICIYGYGQTAYILAALLCAIPSAFVSWLVMLGAAAVSTVFLLRAIVPSVLASEKQSAALGMIVSLGAIQGTYSLLLKILFY